MTHSPIDAVVANTLARRVARRDERAITVRRPVPCRRMTRHSIAEDGQL